MSGDYPDTFRDGYSHSTINTYYAWLRGVGGARTRVSRHYARESDAENPFPDSNYRRSGDQQAWIRQIETTTRSTERTATRATVDGRDILLNYEANPSLRLGFAVLISIVS